MERSVTPEETLLHDLEMWEGREKFAHEQIERIKLELGVKAVKKHLVLLQGGKILLKPSE